MTLIEAIKSGEKFYRSSWLDKTPIGFEDLRKLSKEAFIADDWEVEPTPVPVTREQFDAAWRKTCRETAGPGYDLDDVYQILIKELGL